MRNTTILVLFGIVLSSYKLSGQSKEKIIIYSETEIETVVDTLHGVAVPDPYRWLENGELPEVQRWADVQDALTRSILDSLPMRANILVHLKKLWMYPDQSIPRKYGERYFLWKTDGIQDHWVYCVQKGLKGESQLLIDPNIMSEEKTISLSSALPSEDGKLVAYGLSEGGRENPVLRILNVETKGILPDTLGGWRHGGVSWTHDNKGFFYTRNPLPGSVAKGDEFYYSKVYYHQLGELSDKDSLIFEYSTQKEVSCGVDVSEDGRYLVAYADLMDKNEIYVSTTEGDFIPIVKGFENHYSGTMIEDKLIMRTDWEAPRGRVFSVDINNPSRENWKEIIPEQEDVLEYCIPVGGRLYAVYSHNTYTVLKVFTLEGKFIREIKLPTLGSAWVSGRWKDKEVFVSFTSFAFPPVIYLYNFEEDSLEEFFRPPIEVDVSDIATKQVWYASKDGTKVPMYIIHKQGIVLDGMNPTLLYGYGGFGISMRPHFSSSRILWLEKGGVYAIPGIRGGSEFGEEWHKAGMLGNKQNVFDDFIAAAQWLIENKYTNPGKLAISGGSNGGLLVGAVMVQRPELFKAVICLGPVLDMLRYHLFSVGRYWISEYGCADNPEQFKYLCAYSPYHNVKDRANYPATLIAVGENDPRVDPFHAKKMTARLQNATSGNAPILLSIERKSGHGSGTAKSRAIEQAADTWAFLMWQLGMQK